MPNIEIAKGQTPGRAARQPVNVFDDMRHEMNRLLENFERGWPGLPALMHRKATGDLVAFDIDVRDEGSAIVIEAEIPGVEEKNVSVTVAGGLLTISGEKTTERAEKKADYYVSERSFGSFRRSLRLPDSVDESKIEAKFDKGVLRISAQKKAEAMTAERKIEVKSS